MSSPPSEELLERDSCASRRPQTQRDQDSSQNSAHVQTCLAVTGSRGPEIPVHCLYREPFPGADPSEEQSGALRRLRHCGGYAALAGGGSMGDGARLKDVPVRGAEMFATTTRTLSLRRKTGRRNSERPETWKSPFKVVRCVAADSCSPDSVLARSSQTRVIGLVALSVHCFSRPLAKSRPFYAYSIYLR